MKYMGEFYAKMTIPELNTLRSKKYNRKMKLDHEPKTYLNMQEQKKLAQQIQWIDAELSCRAAQTRFDWS